jgi:two-component system catabolic regulation response regulator CreB/two-component system response regulator ChvI
VDDEEDVARTLQLMLEHYGFDVDAFTDPSMALQKFKQKLYDLMILDIKMAKINGFELYDQLKSRDSSIKTLFITALNSVEPYNTKNIKVYPVKGIRHFIKKPVGNDDLLRQVCSLLTDENEYQIGEDVYQIR